MAQYSTPTEPALAECYYPIELIAQELEVIVPIANFTPEPFEEWAPLDIESTLETSLTSEELEYLQCASDGLAKYEIEAKFQNYNADNKIFNSIKKKFGAPSSRLPVLVRTGFESRVLTFQPQQLTPEQELDDIERELLDHFADGKTVKQLEAELPYSMFAIKTARARIQNKLGAQRMAHIVRKAYEFGIFKLDPNKTTPIAPADSPVNPRSEILLLTDSQRFLVDAASRGIHLSIMAGKLNTDTDSLLYEYQNIIHSVGAASLIQTVDVLLRRKLLRVDRERPPPLLDSQLMLLREIQRGMGDIRIIGSMGINASIYRDLRGLAFRAIGAINNLTAVRQMHKFGLV